MGFRSGGREFYAVRVSLLITSWPRNQRGRPVRADLSAVYDLSVNLDGRARYFRGIHPLSSQNSHDGKRAVLPLQSSQNSNVGLAALSFQKFNKCIGDFAQSEGALTAISEQVSPNARFLLAEGQVTHPALVCAGIRFGLVIRFVSPRYRPSTERGSSPWRSP